MKSHLFIYVLHKASLNETLRAFKTVFETVFKIFKGVLHHLSPVSALGRG